MTYKTGTFNEFMQWTKHVITDPAAAKDAPRQWFDSEETAAKAGKQSASAEAFSSNADSRIGGDPAKIERPTGVPCEGAALALPEYFLTR